MVTRARKGGGTREGGINTNKEVSCLKMEQAGSGRDKAAFPSPDGRCHGGIISAIRRENPMS